MPEAVVAGWKHRPTTDGTLACAGWRGCAGSPKLAKNGKIELEYVGIRPNLDQIKLAGGSEIDAMIRDVALELGASFLTSDQVQSRVAEAMGLDVEYVRPQREAVKPLSMERYFTEDTLSIHLKKGAIPMAKRGRVGDFSLVRLGERPLSGGELRDLSRGDLRES